MPASAAKAASFASAPSVDPVPQPGRYPVVFSTGAGEPTRDATFVYDHEALGRLVPDFWERYSRSPRYVEFKANSGLTDDQFRSYLSTAFLLGLAQQTVHSHVNMGFPQLDFAPINSSEVPLPNGVRAVLSQFGEWQEPMLGTRFLLSSYPTTVSRLVLWAQQVYNGGSGPAVCARGWLPMSSQDPVTRTAIADRLNGLLGDLQLTVNETALEEAVLSGTVPDWWENLKSFFGDPPGEGQTDERDRFDFLFRSYANAGAFTVAFTTTAASAVLEELDLKWDRPNANHMDWDFNAKSVFSDLADRWSRVATAYGQFFEMSSGTANRTSARGSAAQMVDVRIVEGVTILKTHLALSAPGFSLAAAFPPECLFTEGLRRNVVVTTPVNVQQRATEFLQSDWR